MLLRSTKVNTDQIPPSRRRWIPRATFAVPAILALLTASACSTSDSTTTTSSPIGDLFSATENVDPRETLAYYLGPLFVLSIDPERMAQAYLEVQEQGQKSIAACMAEGGFEYVPMVRPPSRSIIGPSLDPDVAREEGFGITTDPTIDRLLDQSLLDTDDPSYDWARANIEIIQSLSESEQEAYGHRLYLEYLGDAEPIVEIDPDTGEEYEYYEEFGTGCTGQAESQAWDVASLESLIEQLEIGDIEQQFESDPRISDVDVEWSDCMATKGYNYTSPEDFQEEVYEYLQDGRREILGIDDYMLRTMDELAERGLFESYDETSSDDVDAARAASIEVMMEGVDQDTLAALRQEEQDMAVAYAQCTAPISKRFDEVFHEIELAIIEPNRALLEEYRAERLGLTDR